MSWNQSFYRNRWITLWLTHFQDPYTESLDRWSIIRERLIINLTILVMIALYIPYWHCSSTKKSIHLGQIQKTGCRTCVTCLSPFGPFKSRDALFVIHARKIHECMYRKEYHVTQGFRMDTNAWHSAVFFECLPQKRRQVILWNLHWCSDYVVRWPCDILIVKKYFPAVRIVPITISGWMSFKTFHDRNFNCSFSRIWMSCITKRYWWNCPF